MNLDLDDLDTIAKYLKYGPNRKDNRLNKNAVFINLRELKVKHFDKSKEIVAKMLDSARTMKPKTYYPAIRKNGGTS